MSWIRVALAFIFFIILLFANYQFDTASKTAMGFAKKDVLSFIIKRPGEETIEIKRAGNYWQLVSPVADKADLKTVDQIISTAVDLSVEKDLDIVVPQELGKFGLADPVIIIFRLDNKQERAIRIGGINPAGTERFIQTDASLPNVLLVKKEAADKLVKNFFELRNKNIFNNVNENTVKKLEIRKGDLRIVLEKNIKDNWKLLFPITSDADNDMVNDLAQSLGGVQVAGFIGDGEYDPAKYGLDNPSATIIFTTIGDQVVTAYVGSKTESGARYLALEGAHRVVRTPSFIFTKLPNSIDAIRGLKLADIEAEDVEKITIEHGDKVFVLEANLKGKINSGQDRKWKVISPLQATADNTTVFKLLRELELAKGKRYTDEGEVDYEKLKNKGDILKFIATTGTETKTVELVKIASGDEHKCYSRALDSVSILEIDKKVCKPFYDIGPKHFIDRRFFPITSDGVGAAVVERNGEVFELRVAGNGYRMVKPEERYISDAMYSSFVWTILLLKYTGVVPEADTDRMGFENSTLKMAIYNRRNELVNKVIVGNKITGKEKYYAKSGNDGKIYEIDSKFIEEKIVNILKNSLDL